MNWLKENWFKVGVLIALFLGISLFYIRTFPPNSNLKSDTPIVAIPSSNDQLAEKERCTTRAQEYFKTNYDTPTNSQYDFVNHFNGILRSCFIAVTHYEGVGSKSDDKFFDIQLVDIYENKIIAEFYRIEEAGKPDYLVKPVICTVGDGFCTSKGEFDDYVSKYMESTHFQN